jgi:hypothetical protein
VVSHLRAAATEATALAADDPGGLTMVAESQESAQNERFAIRAAVQTAELVVGPAPELSLRSPSEPLTRPSPPLSELERPQQLELASAFSQASLLLAPLASPPQPAALLLRSFRPRIPLLA